MPPRVSVVIPCYNERATIAEIVRLALAQPLVTEVVAVDDCSGDGTREELARLEKAHARLRVVLHERNRGKGAALRTGFARAAGDVVIVQDADLEYSPSDYPALVRPIAEGRAEAVYGSRYLPPSPTEKRRRELAGFGGGAGHETDATWHAWGNKWITWFSNLATRQHLTDMETCYKVFRARLLRALPLRQDRFGWDPEVTALVARRGIAIREVPIAYRARSYAEGKKIRLKDLFRVVSVIVARGMLGL